MAGKYPTKSRGDKESGRNIEARVFLLAGLLTVKGDEIWWSLLIRVMIRTSIGNISQTDQTSTGCESHETGSRMRKLLGIAAINPKKGSSGKRIDKGTACHAKKKKRVYIILLSTSLQHFDYSLTSLDFQCSIRNMIMVWHTSNTGLARSIKNVIRIKKWRQRLWFVSVQWKQASMPWQAKATSSWEFRFPGWT